MRILYIKLPDGYSDKWTYQENVLTSKFAQLGHETHLVVSPRSESRDGKKILNPPSEYINHSGVHVHILPFTKRFYRLCRKFDYFDSLYGLMCIIKPDFIFSHSVQYASLLAVAKYKRENPQIKLVADNHGDYIIMPIDSIKRWIVQKVIYRFFVRHADPYVDKYYGVSPSRAKYLSEVYGIDQAKIEVIPQMGDDMLAQRFDHDNERKRLCSFYNLDENKTIICFGAGKIDGKKNLMPLVTAVESVHGYELVIFGAFVSELPVLIEEHLSHANIHFIGKLSGIDIYRILIASDIAIYPGQHSVLWDNTVACGTPLCVRRWEGMDYFDVNGNCRYINNGTHEEIVNLLIELSQKNLIDDMRAAASGDAKKRFSASEIVQQILRMD